MTRWSSYVAVGDSFTEGLDDLAPDGCSYRGWADLVAARLAAERVPDSFRYANLAVRGRLFHQIVQEQVPLALQMRPDLISFAGGGNDILRRRFDPLALRQRFLEVVERMRSSGADVIVFRWVDMTTRIPGRRIILPRTRQLNEAVSEAAQRHGAILVDLWSDGEFANPALWSDDRLHYSPAGHRRVAAHVLTALGVAPDPAWLERPAPVRARSWSTDARWVRRHLVPWLGRRLRGCSSGDAVTAKRPALTPVLPAAAGGSEARSIR